MELSMYTVYALMQNFTSPVEALGHFYKKGIRYADIVDDELTEYPLELYCKYLSETGLKPNALVSMLDIASNDKKMRNENIAKVKGYIDLMEKLGFSIIMLAPDVIPEYGENNLNRMQERLLNGFVNIAEYAKGSGIKVTIENQSTLTRADSKMSDIHNILNCVPELGFILDIGNFFCIKEDVLEAYRLLSDRIVHVHAKDWKYDINGSYVRDDIPRFEGTALGTGIIPLKKIISMLKEDGYEGKINLEVNSPKITLNTLDISADYLRSEINV